ncbi:MAG: xanthine dehydrogenase family protein molybdopterin-binding subunit, partial [Acidimicrobiales bacterium]
MSILGNRVLRREDPALLTTGGTYVDDIAVPDAAFVTYVRSTMAHARLAGIDTSEAATMPGVLAVVTAADIDLPDLPPATPAMDQSMARPLLARDVVRFVGEPIVAIVTERREQGPDAAEAVFVDYDPLKALVDPELSRDGGPKLFDQAESNVIWSIEARNRVADFAGCDVVVSQRMVNQRVAACPIEGRTATAWWADGRLTQYQSCQGAHPVRTAIAELYGLDPAEVRVVCPDVGGSFGATAGATPELLLLGELARRAGRPVRWFETRTENMTAMGHGRGQVQDVTIGGTRDGRITAYAIDVLQDAGAYPGMGALLPWMTRMMTSGVYELQNVGFSSTSVVTTTTPMVAYRGAGRPEAAAALERAVDLFAAEIGMDPADVRRANVLAPDAFPYTTRTGTEYDSGDYARALDLVLEAAGYRELRAEQQRRRDAGDTVVLGIGLSVYVEVTGGGSEYGEVELRPDGTVLVKTGSNPYGQGHHTAWAMLVSDRLGIPMERIEVVHGDTDLIPAGAVTGGSRSVQLAGAAVHDAAGKLLDVARQRAADLLEAAPDDIVLDRDEGRFHVAGTPTIGLGWEELGVEDLDPLGGLSDLADAKATFPFGAHVAVVEVDTETGQARLTRLVAVDDAGRILNPLLAEGQVHGGLAQGVAQALYEEVRFDEEGNPLTSNFADYAIVSATEVPMFERVPMETLTPLNELGAKGIGESGTIGSTPAVHNAVIDALAHLGVRHIDMPVTPEKIWRALSS